MFLVEEVEEVIKCISKRRRNTARRLLRIPPPFKFARAFSQKEQKREQKGGGAL